MTFWEKAQAVDRRVLYAILIVCVSAGLFLPLNIPTDPDPSSKSLYSAMQKLEAGDTVIIQTDWTNSTRGESMGHFENLMRLLMSKDVKFVFYSAADPIAPQVARTVISRIHAERGDQGLKVYQIGEDYIDLGFFANAEATNTSMGTNLRNAWSGKKTKMPDGSEIDIWDSPVLRDINSIGDAGMMVVVTASASIDIAVQRLNKEVQIGAMVTGVVGPSVLPFYQANQVVGVAVGLKGVYDMEYMMEYGINEPAEDGGKPLVNAAQSLSAPPVSEGIGLARGASYYGTLHIALLLLILAVVMGNVAMFMSRKRKEAEN